MDAQFGWNARNPHVKKALVWLKAHWDEQQPIEVDEIIEWDRKHGRRLFQWDDTQCGVEYRRQQARLFLGRFEMRLNGFRVKGWYSVRDGDETATAAAKGAKGAKAAVPADRAYWPTTAVVEQPTLRAKVIQDVTRRIETQAATLRFLQLTEAECESILTRVERALGREIALAQVFEGADATA